MSTGRPGFLLLPYGFLAAVVLQACNCGGSEAERFCEELATTICDHEIACGRWSAAHREQCIENGGRTGCPENAERVNRGFARFDPAKGTSCHDEIRARTTDCSAHLDQSPFWGGQLGGFMQMLQSPPEFPSCGSRYPSPARVESACSTVFSPAASKGGACSDSIDCVDEKDGCARGKNCEGTCETGGSRGEPCRLDGCDPELYCNPLTSRCEERVALGGECQFGHECDFSVGTCDEQIGQCVPHPGEGDPCTFRCGPGLICSPAGSTSATCVKAARLNESCNGYGTCDTGLLCVSGTCRLPGNEGDSCSGFIGCRDDLRCVEGTCAPRLGEHGSCRIVFWAGRDDPLQSCMQCELQFGCDGVLGTCERPRFAADGEPCTGSTVHCENDLICRGAWTNPDGGAGVTGKCEPRRVGAPCELDWECPSQTYCDLAQDGGVGVCATARDGSPCGSGEQCLVEHWCDVSGTRTCNAAALQEGVPCTETFLDPSCAPGLECVRGSTGSVCYRRGALDEACDQSVPFGACQNPLQCVEGRCREAATIGEECGPSSWCKDGFCGGIQDGETTGRCEALRPDGEACTQRFECAGGWCDDGKCVSVCR